MAAFKHSGMRAWVALTKTCTVTLLLLLTDTDNSGGRGARSKQARGSVATPHLPMILINALKCYVFRNTYGMPLESIPLFSG